MSREDFHAMTEIAQEEGVFKKSESTVIKNIIDFGKILAKDIMTPRTVMNTASEDISIQTFYDNHPVLKFSRIPIFSKVPDNISGYILKDQLLEAIIKGNGETISYRRSAPDRLSKLTANPSAVKRTIHPMNFMFLPVLLTVITNLIF